MASLTKFSFSCAIPYSDTFVPAECLALTCTAFPILGFH